MEWSRYYRLRGSHSAEVLHAHFITHHYPRHAHDYFVVGLIEAGIQSYWYRGARHTAPAGHIFLVNADEVHTGESATKDGYIYRALYPRREDLSKLAEDIGGRATVPFFKPAVLRDPLLAGLLSRFHECLATSGSQMETESLFIRAMTRLFTSHCDPQVWSKGLARGQGRGRERPVIRRALDYLESYFADDTPLSALASMVGLSPYYFARTFQKEVGLPPHKYLEGIRIRKAREFLDRGISLTETALSVGYSDQSHLTRRFKQFLGITPGQYAQERKSAVRPAQ